MIGRLNINQIENKSIKQGQNVSTHKLIYNKNEDTFVKEPELSKEVKTSLANFIYNCDFEEVVNNLLQKNTFGGMTSISTNYDKKGNLLSMSYIDFDLLSGTSQVHSVKVQDFLNIVQFSMYKKLSENPQKAQEYNSLYEQLVNKLSKK